LTQDHIEQLLSAYAQPIPAIECRVIAYRLGEVGRLQVKRDRRELPYRVKKALGDSDVVHQRIGLLRPADRRSHESDVRIAALEPTCDGD
jgi:hypothetical protein